MIEALSLLKQYWRDEYHDLAEFTRVIVPIDPSGSSLHTSLEANGHVNNHRTHLAFTVSSRQGAIYIGPAPVDSSIEMLIHENAHVKMRQIQTLDPLLRDPLDEAFKVPVPWRPDPRPLPGILEGLFVFAHVAEFECQRWHADPASLNIASMNKRLKGLCYAVECLEENAKLTDGGIEFLAMMKHWVSDLRCRVPME